MEALKKQEVENERLQELYDSLSEEERGFIWQKIEEQKRDEVRADFKRPKGLKRILKKICSRASTPSSPQEAAG